MYLSHTELLPHLRFAPIGAGPKVKTSLAGKPASKFRPFFPWYYANSGLISLNISLSALILSSFPTTHTAPVSRIAFVIGARARMSSIPFLGGFLAGGEFRTSADGLLRVVHRVPQRREVRADGTKFTCIDTCLSKTVLAVFCHCITGNRTIFTGRTDHLDHITVIYCCLLYTSLIISFLGFISPQPMH